MFIQCFFPGIGDPRMVSPLCKLKPNDMQPKVVSVGSISENRAKCAEEAPTIYYIVTLQAPKMARRQTITYNHDSLEAPFSHWPTSSVG